MSSLLINPHYCPEDKDIVDFVNSSGIALSEFVEFLRKRQVYVPGTITREVLAEVVAREIFVWEDVQELLKLLSISKKREKVVMASHLTGADIEVLEQAVASVSQTRNEKYGEGIKITPTANGGYRVAIEYRKVDYEKTRLIQCVECDTEILFDKTGDGFKTRRSSDVKAGEVELAILGEFERLAVAEKQELVSEKMLLSRLVSVEEKVRFFTHLMENIKGYKFQEIKSVKIQSSANEHEVLDSEEGDELAEEYASTIESLIVSGKNLGATDLYDHYVGKGYYLTSASWTVASDTDECRVAELKVSFAPYLNDQELQMSLVGVQLYRSGEIQSKAKPNAIQVSTFAEYVRTCAEEAIRKIESERKKEG
ncbi:hypothetical protein [Verrucomicrobium sp. BvORR034]|uniref:hypothetical protein n=1 Tax=Verrucomicrobium sp. BvORR034 TaxID=1396418 RepID=UPI000B204537|nr:hypothetical protein [Verrucomicrobium sp. BvORR034]